MFYLGRTISNWLSQILLARFRLLDAGQRPLPFVLESAELAADDDWNGFGKHNDTKQRISTQGLLRPFGLASQPLS